VTAREDRPRGLIPGSGQAGEPRDLRPRELHVLGCDPGPTTGIALLETVGTGLRAMTFQCNGQSAHSLASWLIEASEGPADVMLAGERFVAGRGAGARGPAASATRSVIADLDGLGRWHWRMAGEVKPWATDARLKAAGLLGECHGMPHALDACRHALFCAVRDGGYPDPLSRKATELYARSLAREKLEKQ
jgi:hypothetical protein